MTVAGESGVAGSQSYQLNNPTSITFDQYKYMYVLDTANNRVQRWAPAATYGITIVSGSMNTPYGLKFDFTGTLYVADYNNHRIGSFKMNCRKLHIAMVQSISLCIYGLMSSSFIFSGTYDNNDHDCTIEYDLKWDPRMILWLIWF